MLRKEGDLFQIGEIVGNYRIVRRLGRGGMGEVYLAWEEELQRNVAIKILLPEALGDKDMVERFKGEGRALARINHPNVISLYQFGEKGTNPYIVMEYVEGTSLDHMIKKHPLGILEVIQIAKQILSGLAVAHETGIIHRDVKPENVLIDKDLNAKLLDFGIAKVHFDQRSVNTSMDVLIGTMNYVAPEIVMGKMASRQSDIYSAGLTLFYMLQGSIPFDGRNNLAVLEQIRTVDIRFSPNLELILPDRLKKVVQRMTNRNLQARYMDAREVIRDLEEISPQNLPHELRYSPEPHAEIGNRKEIEESCARLGFDTSETRVIINLAAAIVREKQAIKAEEDDETTFAGEVPDFKIDAPDLESAIAKYRGLKSRMITRRTQKVKNPHMRKAKPPLWRAVAVGLVGFSAAAFLGYKLLWRKDALSRADAMAARKVAAASPTPAPAPAKPALAPQDPWKTLNLEMQTWPAGTRAKFRFQVNSERRGFTSVEEEWVVAESDGRRLKILVNGETMERLNNPFVPLLESGNVVGREDFSRSVIGDDMAIFPLAPGKQFSLKIAGETRYREVMSYDYKCVVGKLLKTITRAGEFDVIEVNCIGSGVGIEFSSRYLYSPAIGGNVFFERKGASDKGLTMRRELLYFKKP